MNLIKLFGYEKIKDALKTLIDEKKDLLTVGRTVYVREEIESMLSDYRRENNIFEKGDKVVYHSLSHQRLFSVRYTYDGEIVVYELWDEMGAKTFTEFYPYSDIRHATDKEIAQGYRDE